MIVEKINQQIAQALKEGNNLRVSTLRMLSSALNYEFIAKQHKLNNEEEVEVVRREAKKRKDAIEAYESVKGKKSSSGEDIDQRIRKEEDELKILKEYLPEDITDEQLNKLIDETIQKMQAKTIADMGKIIGAVKAKTQGRAEGSVIAQKVKAKLC